MDMSSKASGTSTMGAYLDLGSASKSDWYEVVLTIGGFTSAPVAQRAVELRFSQSNATTGFDGQPSTDPTAIAEGSMNYEKSLNCKFVGALLTTSATAADVLQGRYRVRLTGRYVSPVIYNITGATTGSTGTDHSITLTPIPQEDQ